MYISASRSREHPQEARVKRVGEVGMVERRMVEANVVRFYGRSRGASREVRGCSMFDVFVAGVTGGSRAK